MNSLTISPQKRATQTNWNDPSVPIVSALAHELRNPLTNIILTVHLLESKILDNNDRLYIDIIRRSSGKINDQINDLLKGQKMDEIQTEKHSIHQLLDEVVEMAKDRLVLKKVMVKKNYAPYDLKVKMNKSKLKIAFTNIIINAIDAMPSEKGELRLCTKLIRGRHAVSIQDNGCGISKENLPFIFNPYFTNKPGGVGVGLAATKDILLSNQIGVKVESMVGEGTRFILLFEKNKIVTGRKDLKIKQSAVSRNKSLVRVASMA
jgi:signal transduction histidine kinase